MARQLPRTPTCSHAIASRASASGWPRCAAAESASRDVRRAAGLRPKGVAPAVLVTRRPSGKAATHET